MLDIPPSLKPLDEFRVSYETGFLPININNNRKIPLQRLSNPYFSPWEDVISDLPQLIQTGEIRQKVLDLPVLSVEDLDADDEAEWQRAYLILAFLTHAYIWGGEKAEDKLPPSISRPFLTVSAHLELPPCATYAALNLWNFTTVNNSNNTENEDNIDLTNPDNIYTINSFTGTDDERWFLVVSVAMEACGAKMIRLVLDSITTINTTTTTADDNDSSLVESTSNRNTILTNLLNGMGECIDELGCILERMYERNDPIVFYHQIRPLLAGSKNMGAAGLPNGVFYDTGDDTAKWHQYSGGSNGQSSLVQLIDLALGIQHIASGEVEGKTSKDKHTAFMKEMRNYMPGPHRRFLEYVASIANIRPYALSLPASSDVRQAYNAAVMKLGGFRDKHIQIVSRYVILPASRPAPGLSKYKDGEKTRINLASATSDIAAEVENNGTKPRKDRVFYGTGGTNLIPFLKATRDETKAAARFAD